MQYMEEGSDFLTVSFVALVVLFTYIYSYLEEKK